MKVNTRMASDERLQKHLDAVNGKAKRYTIHTPDDVRRIAEDAEERLDKLGLPKVHRPGAMAEYTSGKYLSRKYRYPGIATRLVLIRGSKDWLLTQVERAEARPGDNARPLRLKISRDQDSRAFSALRDKLAITAGFLPT
jgi:hypothetical protein